MIDTTSKPVKFARGSLEDWLQLTDDQKDENTLYVIIDEDNNVAQLFIGKIPISNIGG